MTKHAVFTALPRVDLSHLCDAMTRQAGKAWIVDGRNAWRGHDADWASQGHGYRQRASYGQPDDHPDKQQFLERFHTHIKTSLTPISSQVTLQPMPYCLRYKSGFDHHLQRLAERIVCLKYLVQLKVVSDHCFASMRLDCTVLSNSGIDTVSTRRIVIVILCDHSFSRCRST